MPQPPLVPLGELGTEPFGNGNTSKAPAGTAGAAPSVTIASPVVNWLTNPDPYTFITVRGQRSPGLIPVEGGVNGFEREEKFDVKTGKGTAGATTTHVGMEPAKGSFTFELPNSDSIAKWASFLALFRFDTTKGKGEAVTIYHPMLASVQPPITSVVMTKHSPVKPLRDGRGVVTIDLLEYFPAKATGATTAAGSKTGAGYMQAGKTGDGEDPAVTKLKKQAAALQKQLQGTV